MRFDKQRGRAIERKRDAATRNEMLSMYRQGTAACHAATATQREIGREYCEAKRGNAAKKDEGNKNGDNKQGSAAAFGRWFWRLWM